MQLTEAVLNNFGRGPLRDHSCENPMSGLRGDVV